MMQKEQFKKEFTAFLQSNNLGKEVTEIAGTENLLEAGYIDSLKMVDLIIFLEEITGEEIAIENYQLRNFYTFDCIYQTFIQGNTLAGGRV